MIVRKKKKKEEEREKEEDKENGRQESVRRGWEEKEKRVETEEMQCFVPTEDLRSLQGF